jgi:hypothetical protein
MPPTGLPRANRQDRGKGFLEFGHFSGVSYLLISFIWSNDSTRQLYVFGLDALPLQTLIVAVNSELESPVGIKEWVSASLDAGLHSHITHLLTFRRFLCLQLTIDSTWRVAAASMARGHTRRLVTRWGPETVAHQR